MQIHIKFMMIIENKGKQSKDEGKKGEQNDVKVGNDPLEGTLKQDNKNYSRTLQMVQTYNNQNT